MNVLVAYASRHGATAGIAERIAQTIRRFGLEVTCQPVGSVRGIAEYDAFVIGSAAYMFHWQKDALAFVRRNQPGLMIKPVWLFSSGPIGGPLDAKGRDQKAMSVPKDIPELSHAIRARDHQVFFGAFTRDRKPIGFAEQFTALMPAARDALTEGDFRDWPVIEAWATAIAVNLKPATLEPSTITSATPA